MAFPIPCMFLDVPFSLVGDTLFLPCDAHYTYQVNAHQRELKRNPPDPDPLADWKRSPAGEANTMVMEDYQGYIQQLPPDQKKSLIVNDNMIRLFEDGTGLHAVQIKILVGKTLWKHVLFYNEANKRTAIMKYANGHYRP